MKYHFTYILLTNIKKNCKWFSWEIYNIGESIPIIMQCEIATFFFSFSVDIALYK